MSGLQEDKEGTFIRGNTHNVEQLEAMQKHNIAICKNLLVKSGKEPEEIEKIYKLIDLAHEVDFPLSMWVGGLEGGKGVLHFHNLVSMAIRKGETSTSNELSRNFWNAVFFRSVSQFFMLLKTKDGIVNTWNQIRDIVLKELEKRNGETKENT